MPIGEQLTRILAVIELVSGRTHFPVFHLQSQDCASAKNFQSDMGAPHEHTKLVPEFVQNLYVLTSTLIFMLCQPLLRISVRYGTFPVPLSEVSYAVTNLCH